MEEVCQRDNLWKALMRVQANRGAPGVDGRTVKQLPKYLKCHGPKTRDLIRQANDENFVAFLPTILQIEPFGEHIEGLSLCGN